MRISLGKSGKRPWNGDDTETTSTTSKASSSTRSPRIFDDPEERRNTDIQYIDSIGGESCKTAEESKDSPKASRPSSPYDVGPSDYRIPEDQYGLIVVSSSSKEKRNVEPKRPCMLAHRLQKETTAKLSEEELLAADLAGKPAAPTLKDYERVPISGYGETLLRSMGWDGKPSEVFKKTTKGGPPAGIFGESKPIIKSRIGLGKKSIEGKKGDFLETGASVLIIDGCRHGGFRGKVVGGGVRETSRIKIQLDLSGAVVSVHKDFVSTSRTASPIPSQPPLRNSPGVEGYPVGARVRIISPSLLEGRLYWRTGTVVSLVGGLAGRVQIDKLEGHSDSDTVFAARLEDLYPLIDGVAVDGEDLAHIIPSGTIVSILGGKYLGRIGRVVESSSSTDSLTVHVIDSVNAHESENGNLLFISISRHQVASYRPLYR